MYPYETIVDLCKKHDIPVTVLEKTLGFSRGSISKLKDGRDPSATRLQKIAEYFGVTIEYLMKGGQAGGYYVTDDAIEGAQYLKDRPDLRILLSASRDLRPDDVMELIERALQMKETNPNG